MSVTPIPADLASVAPVLLPLPLPAPARPEPAGATAPVDVVAFSPDGLSQLLSSALVLAKDGLASLAAGAHEMDRLPRPLAPQPLGELADKIGLAAFDLASASPVLQSRTAVRGPIIAPPDVGTLYRPAAAPSEPTTHVEMADLLHQIGTTARLAGGHAAEPSPPERAAPQPGTHDAVPTREAETTALLHEIGTALHLAAGTLERAHEAVRRDASPDSSFAKADETPPHLAARFDWAEARIVWAQNQVAEGTRLFRPVSGFAAGATTAAVWLARWRNHVAGIAPQRVTWVWILAAALLGAALFFASLLDLGYARAAAALAVTLAAVVWAFRKLSAPRIRLTLGKR